VWAFDSDVVYYKLAVVVLDNGIVESSRFDTRVWKEDDGSEIMLKILIGG